MKLPRPFLRSVFAIVVVILALPLVPANAQVSINLPETQGAKPVRTLKELRDEGVVRQRWDMSCGAAALSTILTYDFSDNTPEAAIVVWILHRVDPVRVRARGGFSLLELKHFAQARGYNAEGFSGMSLADLAAEKSWVITPIHVKTVDHFVVVKGIVGDRVIIADPGFGNVTMATGRFMKIWKNGIVFVIQPPDPRMLAPKSVSAASRVVPDETLISRGIGVAIPANALY
ncbi:cysteine peptidase family C39 domain-containing protein [Edaphobacter paludis]|uniref:Cysteine peptidase family C39 domain-containing protein n=1 Tax=Edaphobacter paludis TaxID=3035702 RepID=A0AAU7CXZ2_9BACT